MAEPHLGRAARRATSAMEDVLERVRSRARGIDLEATLARAEKGRHAHRRRAVDDDHTTEDAPAATPVAIGSFVAVDGGAIRPNWSGVVVLDDVVVAVVVVAQVHAEKTRGGDSVERNEIAASDGASQFCSDTAPGE